MRLQTTILVAALAAVGASVLWAAPAENPANIVTITPAAGDANAAAFPYSAEVVGKAVFTRAGAGMNSYRCGQLNAPDLVTVVEEDPSGWAKIVPPTGSFSWVCKQNVTIDPADPGMATVTADPTRVWAGSVYYDPLNSNELQLKLKTGDKVKLLNEEVGNYYKIVPPDGAYLWISTEYIKKVGAATTVAGSVTSAQENPKEKEKLAEYRKLATQLDVERNKPIAQQDYSAIKAGFEALSKDPDAGKAAKYAAIQLERIDRFELAAKSFTDLKEQEQALTELRAKIDAEAQAKMAQVPDMGKYAVTGIFKPSMVYSDRTGSARRYLVTGSDGKILCYAQPTGAAQNRDLSQFSEKNVGLIGTITREAGSPLGLVQFTDIELLD